MSRICDNEIRERCEAALKAWFCPGYCPTNYHCRDCPAEIKQFCKNSHQSIRLVRDLLDRIAELRVEIERKDQVLAVMENDVINAEMNLQRLTDELERLREAQRWIPVTERLPEEREPVQVAYVGYTDNKLYSDGVAMWSKELNAWKGGWVWTLELSEVTVKITHWRPLPEPPQEEG